MVRSWKHVLLPVFVCLVFGGLLVFPGCSTFTSENPPLADTTFARVLVDYHLLSARKNRAEPPLPPGMNDSLLTHHGIQREEFDATLRYYTNHPAAFKSLYNAVIDTLKAVGDRAGGKRRTPVIPDSVQEKMSKADQER